jgi:putative ABC transport system permease protein
VLYALVAVGGAVAVGVFAQWRATSAPVASLLRRTPMRRQTGLIRVGELLVVVLTLAAGYQIYSGGDSGSGLALLTPMFVALTAGLLATRVAGLLAERSGRRALRKGRLSRALFAFSLSRQSSQSQLLGLLVILFTVVGFAISANDVAAQARAARANTELGAARVLAIRDLPGQELLSKVRKVDPDGSYAMAVVRGLDDEEPLLAVDSTRLARVAHWNGAAGTPAAQVAAALRPTAPGAAPLHGAAITLRATSGEQQTGLRVSVLMIDPFGRQSRADLGALQPGEHTYTAPTPQCAQQACRFVGIEVPLDANSGPFQIDLTLHELRLVEPDSLLIDAAGWTDERWRVDNRSDRNPVKLTGSGSGLHLAYTGVSTPETRLLRVLTPLPLPLVATAEPRPTVRTGGSLIPVERAGAAQLLPRMGAKGALVDLEYYLLADQAPGQAREPQVWLSANAPADIADRLRKAGLVIVGDRTIAAETGLADEKGPALALRFYLLVALAAVLLGIGGMAVLANADRQEQSVMLRALRMQGLPTGVAWRQGLGGYAALITTAALVGTAAAAFAWWFARDVVPLFADLGRTAYAPAWPQLTLLGIVLAGSAAVLAVTGVVASMALRRAVEGRAR